MDFLTWLNKNYPNRKDDIHATFTVSDMRKAYEANQNESETFDDIGSLADVVPEET